MDNIIINIDSRFRDKKLFPNSGKFSYSFSEKIKNCKYIRLSSFEFPNLYFTFSAFKMNISFKIIYNSNTYEIKIEDGFYSSDSLMNEIQEELDELNTQISSQFKVKFNINNGAVMLLNNSTFQVDFSNDGSNYPSLGYQLGYRKTFYTASKQTGGVCGCVSNEYFVKTESQLDTIGDNYLFLKVNNYGIIYHDFGDMPNGNFVDKNILAKIIINGNKTDQVFDNGSNFLSKSYTFRQPIDIDKFNIELIDSKNNIIDMIYMDYSMTLEIGVIYDSSLSYELTDVMTNKFMLNGLPNLPSLDKINKNPHNINITSEIVNDKNNDLYKYKKNISSDLEGILDIFENPNMIPIPPSIDVIEKKTSKKKPKNKFNFKY